LENIKISKDEVTYVAHLARLEFKEEEMEDLTSKLNSILLYIDKLSEVDTAQVEPLSSATQLSNAFRDDAMKDSISVEESLDNAPDAHGGFFQVPKVIE
jgi:aspartyl-tRNA(Asn)/glutamyl-tRNA(Gln) amidotransferase subunit C